MVDPRIRRPRGGEGTVPTPSRGIALPGGGFVPVGPQEPQLAPEQILQAGVQRGLQQGRAEVTMAVLRLLAIPVPPEIQNGNATVEQQQSFHANQVTGTLVSGNLRRQVYAQLDATYGDIEFVVTAPPTPGGPFAPNQSDPAVYVKRQGSEMRYRVVVTTALVEDPGPFGSTPPDAAIAPASEPPPPPPKAAG